MLSPAQAAPYVASVRAYETAHFGSASPGMRLRVAKIVHACRGGRRCGPRDLAALIVFREGDGAGEGLVFVTSDPARPDALRYATITVGGGALDVPGVEAYGLSPSEARALLAPNF